MITRSVLFSLICTRNHLAAGLRQLKRSPRPISRIKGWDGTPQEGWEREGEGREGEGRKGKGGKGKGVLSPPKPKNETPPMYILIYLLKYRISYLRGPRKFLCVRSTSAEEMCDRVQNSSEIEVTMSSLRMQ